MAWTRTNLPRSYPCNTSFLKFYRNRRNWTQKQLAERVGYSERLIRKAESGQSISISTIDELATVLSSDETKIYPEDLITCHESLARAFTEAWYSKQQHMADVIKHFVHDDTRFHILGDQRCLPFAGCYRGPDDFSRAAGQFFSKMEVPAGHDFKTYYKYVARGLEVSVWGESWIHPIGAPLNQPVPITQRFRFERGKLHTFVDFCSQRLATPPICSARVAPAAPLKASREGEETEASLQHQTSRDGDDIVGTSAHLADTSGRHDFLTRTNN